MDCRKKSILKAITWRIGGTLSTIIISLILSNDMNLSLQIGLLDTLIKVGIYYFHERIWNNIKM